MSTLTESHKIAFWEKGYTVVREFFSTAVLSQVRAECERLADFPGLLSQTIPEANVRKNLKGEYVRDRLDPVIHLSPVLENLVRHKKLNAGLSELFEDQPALFKDKLIFKPPGTLGYALHQDYAYWEQTDIPANGVLSVQVAIDPADAESGAIVFYPGLHKERLRAPAGNPKDVCPSAVDPWSADLIITEPGDVVIFHSLTPHESGPNYSNHYRRTLYFSFNASQYGDYYQTYYGDRLAV